MCECTEPGNPRRACGLNVSSAVDFDLLDRRDFSLLRDALKRTGKIAIATFVKRIREKVRKHETHELTPPSRTREDGRQSAEVIDLMAVLKKSLEGGANGSGQGQRRGPRRHPKRAQSTGRSRRTA